MLSIRKASAGSGKTFQLTYEFMRLSFGYEDSTGKPHLFSPNEHETHKHILAITFTNKATEEMKQRIVNELHKIASGKESKHLPLLCNYYSADETTIRNQAKKVLVELLHNFTEFNVSTIDSFFQSILRTFAREVEIGGEYGVELSDEAVINRSTLNLISSVNTEYDSGDNRLLNWLRNYLISQIDGKKNWNVFSSILSSDTSENSYDNMLSKIAKGLANESFKSHKKELLEYLSDKNRISRFREKSNNYIDSLIEEMRQLASSFFQELSIGNGNKDAISQSSTVYRRLNALSNKKSAIIDNSVIEKFNDYSWIKKGFDPLQLPLSSLEKILVLIVEKQTVVNTLNTMMESLYELGLLGDICNNIERYRLENDIIMLSDTNELLQRIIGEDETPFIYERVGMKINNFLIDEFQDTSKMQWENMRPLLSESLSRGNFNLIIGDVKQSIYRFRNADPSLLQKQVYSDFKDQIYAGADEASTNHRSSTEVISFNNSVFTAMRNMPEFSSNLLTDTYSNVVQRNKKKDKKGEGGSPDGYVEVDFISTDDTSDFHTEAIKKCIATIRDIVSRGYKQKDIMVLVNKHFEGAKIVEAILNDSSQDGITLNVVSDESLLLKNCTTINLIINVLQYIDNDIIIKPTSDGSHNNLIAMLRRYHSYLSQEMEPAEALNRAIAEQDNDETNASSSPASLFLIVESIIRDFVPETNRSKDAAFISAFQDIILDFCSRYTPTIHSFLDWWEINSKNLSITSPESTDAIKVQTIHSAKGLESKCVIIPFADWKLIKNDSLLWVNTPEKFRGELDAPPVIPLSIKKDVLNTLFSGEIEESRTKCIIDNLNKTYVAFTRAELEMYIYAPVPKYDTDINFYLLKAINSPKITIDDVPMLDLPEGNVPDTTTYRYGLPLHPKHKRESELLLMPSYHPSSGTIKAKFVIPENENSYNANHKRGVLYHNILSRVSYVDEIPLRVKQCAAKGMIKGTEVDKITQTLISILSAPEVAKWFDTKNKVINERSIAFRGHTKRPDRVVITPEGDTIVIDYKFGSKHMQEYHADVAQYMNLLSECGFKNISGYVWYPLESIIETVESNPESSI